MNCIDCGKPISQLSTRCQSCAYIFGWNKPYSGYYTKDFNWRLKKKIKERDNYKCQMCDVNESTVKQTNKQGLHVHHIDYNKRNSSPDNLISLCPSCHAVTNGSREIWTEQLSKRII